MKIDPDLDLPTLYKRTEIGQIQQWFITVSNNAFTTTEGILNGKLTTSKPTVCEGKNIGKANETSPNVQASKEAESKWKKKVESGYSIDINNVDDAPKFFEPMLAEHYEDYKDKIVFPVLVSHKIDGARLVAQKNGLWTRNGKEYVSVPHIAKILKPLFDKHPTWVIDGEAFSSLVPFEEIMSLIKKKKPTSEDLQQSAKLVQYHIFDGFTDINKGFAERFQEIKNEIRNLIGNDPHIVFVENEEVNTHKEIETKHDEYVANGAEGLMIRVKNSLYENKLSKMLLKYKHFFDAEFPIVDILEGQGNRSGMAGKLVIRLTDGRTQESGIRGGELFYQRLLQERNMYIGKKATIRYQNLTDDGKLRFPVATAIDPIDR